LLVAVDDAGAGYANFRHILSLAPDIIKLDMSITRDIHLDRARRALAAALIGFANATGSKIVAEGVESAQEMAVLRELGVNKVQGYFVGRPMTLAAAAVFGLSMPGAGPA
jgi:EAL domain-containing protein (putative c-di-GMP-specific phosphodiesterase class I)